MLHRCNVREWEWEGMGINCTGMGGSGNVKSHFRASLVLSLEAAQVNRGQNGKTSCLQFSNKTTTFFRILPKYLSHYKMKYSKQTRMLFINIETLEK